MKIGLLGYGKMGKEIYGLLCEAHEVTVYVRRPEAAEKGNRQAEKRIQRALRNGEMDETRAAARREALRFTTEVSDLSACELVIESIVEDVDAKVALLRRVEAVVDPAALLVTNSSAFGIAALAGTLQASARFAGLHFFHPITLSSIVEVLSWEGMAAATGDALAACVQALGKRPLRFKDGPGSVLNTILSPYYLEGLYLLEQGVGLPSRIDRIAGEFCRIGPIESIDSVGLPFLAATHVRIEHVLPATLPLPALPFRLMEAGREGRSAGAGVYRYESDVAHDEELAFYYDPAQTHSRSTGPLDDGTIRRRLEYAVLCGALCNAARGVGSLDDLDYGIREILAMDEGPVTHVRRMGLAQARRELGELQRSVGPRFDPRLLDVITE